MERVAYGTDRSQYGELYRPVGAARPGVVVVVHGGFWRAQYGLALGRPLAADLMARGRAVWNVEYRRVGSGGGWPGTLDDIGAAVDALADLDVDTSSVVTVGHSAGGHLAVWVAGRSDARVAVTGVVSQAGVIALREAFTRRLGERAVPDFVGGSPDEVPHRYDVADPVARVPLPAPVICVHSPADDVVPISQSEAYVAAASAAGGDARLVRASGDHFAVIDPAAPDWELCVDAIDELSGR